VHIEEAQWIRDVLENEDPFSLTPVLNVGSSTKLFREFHQPFIDGVIFAPLRDRGVSVTHSDIKSADGVDLVGDITQREFCDELKGKKYRVIICSNLLEHVPDPKRFIDAINYIAQSQCLIVITVPFKYPRHMDPIDNLFRPSVADLKRLLPETEYIQDAVLNVGRPIRSFKKNPGQLIKSLLRCLVPFYRYSGWLTTINKVGWMFRERKITCVAFRKA